MGCKRVRKLAAQAEESVDELSPQHRAVHQFVVRELPGFGGPLPAEHIADAMELPVSTVTAMLADLEARKGFLFRNEDGAVAWAYPVTVEPTPHRISFRSGETLYAA